MYHWLFIAGYWQAKTNHGILARLRLDVKPLNNLRGMVLVAVMS